MEEITMKDVQYKPDPQLEFELQHLETLAMPTASRWRQAIFGDGNY